MSLATTAIRRAERVDSAPRASSGGAHPIRWSPPSTLENQPTKTSPEDAKSVTRQIDNDRAFAESQGWAVDERYTFSDDGVSDAETRKLVEKQRMLDLITNGAPFEVLVMLG